MSQNIYVDTNIWIDYWIDRKSGLIPFGDFATQMFNRVLDCEFTIITSEYIISELKNNFKFELAPRLGVFKSANKLKVVPSQEGVFSLAKSLSEQRSLPFYDAIHVCMAKQEDAILITRDKHFQLVNDLVSVSLPEEL